MDQLNNPPYGVIRDRLREGKVIPFLGAGASLGKREPNFMWSKDCVTCPQTAIELARHLAQQTNFPHDLPPDLPPDPDLRKKHETRVLEHFPPDLAQVAQYYHIVSGRDPLEDELHGIFDRDYQHTSLHTCLADISVPLLIVTTNYDDLIERAFVSKGRAYDVVVHTTDPDIGDRILWQEYGTAAPREINPNELPIDLKKVSVVYKIHGAVDRRDHKRDQYIITEDDYIDFLARMVRDTAIPHIFTQAFQYRHFLFLGYGLRDWNMRVVWNRIERDVNKGNPKHRRDFTSWAIQHKISPLERRFWQEHQVETYEMTTDEFVRGLFAPALSQTFSDAGIGNPSSHTGNVVGG